MQYFSLGKNGYLQNRGVYISIIVLQHKVQNTYEKQLHSKMKCRSTVHLEEVIAGNNEKSNHC